MSTEAEQLVHDLLENDDEHVKAYQKLQKWDRAVGSYKDLMKLHRKRDELERELGQALSVERALAYKGLTRENVDHFVYAGQLGATDNYKKEFPVHVCTDSYCAARGQPMPKSQETCRTCDNPLSTVMKPISRGDLHGKFAQYVVGVVTRDGRKVWFDEMVPPRHHDWGAE